MVLLQKEKGTNEIILYVDVVVEDPLIQIKDIVPIVALEGALR